MNETQWFLKFQTGCVKNINIINNNYEGNSAIFNICLTGIIK